MAESLPRNGEIETPKTGLGMDLHDALSTLLDHACPAIKFRLRKEILGEDVNTLAMENLQSEIARNRSVRRALSFQHPSGSLGEVFHAGIDFNSKTQNCRTGAEGIIRFLHEMGLSPMNPQFLKGIEALRRDDWFGEKKGVCWVYYPEHNMYGLDFVRCVTIAQLGIDDEMHFREHISRAVQVLSEAADFGSYEDLTQKYSDRGRNRLVFREGVRFPEVYHLKLLAATSSWRTKEQQHIVQKGIQKLIDLSPILPVKVLHKRMCLGPATIYPSDLRAGLCELRDAGWNRCSWADWFHTFELLARMGFVPLVPDLLRQATQLAEILRSGNGFFTLPLTEKFFRRWTIYTGAALEDSWTNETRKWGLTFRSLLILYYSGLLGQSAHPKTLRDGLSFSP